MPRNSENDPFAPKGSAEALGKLLDECGVKQVTFTGWKAELEECERKLKIAKNALEWCQIDASMARSPGVDPWPCIDAIHDKAGEALRLINHSGSETEKK